MASSYTPATLIRNYPRERFTFYLHSQPKLHCCVDSTNYLQFVLNSKPLASGSTSLVQHDTRHITNNSFSKGPTLMSVACRAFLLPAPLSLALSLSLPVFLLVEVILVYQRSCGKRVRREREKKILNFGVNCLRVFFAQLQIDDEPNCVTEICKFCNVSKSVAICYRQRAIQP